jgi:hypothetical protein
MKNITIDCYCQLFYIGTRYLNEINIFQVSNWNQSFTDAIIQRKLDPFGKLLFITHRNLFSNETFTSHWCALLQNFQYYNKHWHYKKNRTKKIFVLWNNKYTHTHTQFIFCYETMIWQCKLNKQQREYWDKKKTCEKKKKKREINF